MIREFRAKDPPQSWATIGLFFGVKGDQVRVALRYADAMVEKRNAEREAANADGSAATEADGG